jgi:hypothetical protein
MKLITGSFFFLLALVFSCKPGDRKNELAGNYCPFDKAHKGCEFKMVRSPLFAEAEKFACERFIRILDTVMWVNNYADYQVTPFDQSCVFWMKEGKGYVTVFDHSHPKGESRPVDWIPLISLIVCSPVYDVKDSTIWPTAKKVFNCRKVSVELRRDGCQTCFGTCPDSPESGMQKSHLATLRRIDSLCRTFTPY